jgi:hypothetical protein
MTTPDERDRRMAEAVRTACLEAAVEAWEQGGMSGLCVEGRWDLALDRLRSLDLEAVIREMNRHD